MPPRSQLRPPRRLSTRGGRAREQGDATRGKALALLASRVRRSRTAPVRSPRGRHQRGQPGFMTERQRATPPANSARIAVAGMMIAGAALAMAGQAGADPAVPYPTPVPAGPGAATPAPGQPVAESSNGPVGPPPPPPVGAPPVPEISNPVYGSGQSGSGPLGSLRDIWHQVRDGNPLDAPPGDAPAPPPGAGPAPPLPPGYISLNAPGSETASLPKGPAQAGPPLPPGYYPLNGPPPPGYGPPTGPDPAAPPTTGPVPPTP
jgi:hypothetical protein